MTTDDQVRGDDMARGDDLDAVSWLDRLRDALGIAVVGVELLLAIREFARDRRAS